MNRIVTFSQLAFKARKVVMGDRLIPAIQSGRVYVVIFSSDTGKNRSKKLKDKCTYYGVPWIEMDALAFCQISNRAIQSFGITDKKLANEIIEKGQVIANGV